MLNVAFTELVGGGAKQMLPGQTWFGMDERHDVLKLIAETVSAAGLIEAGPAPKPATQRLIEQPAVGHDVHGWIGSFDLHRGERAIPVSRDAFEFHAARILPAE